MTTDNKTVAEYLRLNLKATTVDIITHPTIDQ